MIYFGNVTVDQHDDGKKNAIQISKDMLNDDLDDTVNVYTEVIQVETYAIHNKLTYLPIAFMYSSKFSDAEIFHFPIILAIFPSYIL